MPSPRRIHIQAPHPFLHRCGAFYQNLGFFQQTDPLNLLLMGIHSPVRLVQSRLGRLLFIPADGIAPGYAERHRLRLVLPLQPSPQFLQRLFNPLWVSPIDTDGKFIPANAVTDPQIVKMLLFLQLFHIRLKGRSVSKPCHQIQISHAGTAVSGRSPAPAGLLPQPYSGRR